MFLGNPVKALILIFRALHFSFSSRYRRRNGASGELQEFSKTLLRFLMFVFGCGCEQRLARKFVLASAPISVNKRFTASGVAHES
jgi:hypothetical protein